MVRRVRLSGKEGPREQEPGKGQQKEGMRERERKSERQRAGSEGGRGRHSFLEPGGNPPDPPLQAWLAGDGQRKPRASHAKNLGQAKRRTNITAPSPAINIRRAQQLISAEPSEQGPPSQ